MKYAEATLGVNDVLDFIWEWLWWEYVQSPRYKARHLPHIPHAERLALSGAISS